MTRLCAPDIVLRTRGCWHLNTRLLEEERILREAAQAMKKKRSPSMTTEMWDAIKNAAKEIFQEWGMKPAREEREDIPITSDAILVFSAPLSKGPSIAATLTQLSRELHKHLNKSWDKLQATACAERWEKETWCSRHLLCRRLATQSDILTAVEDSTIRATTAPDNVLQIASDFYRELFTAESCDIDEFPLHAPRDGPVIDTTWLTEEVYAALKTMKPNRKKPR